MAIAFGFHPDQRKQGKPGKMFRDFRPEFLGLVGKTDLVVQVIEGRVEELAQLSLVEPRPHPPAQNFDPRRSLVGLVNLLRGRIQGRCHCRGVVGVEARTVIGAIMVHGFLHFFNQRLAGPTVAFFDGETARESDAGPFGLTLG